jgi:ABC-type polar amino acid transport system ATPase subunit
MNKCLSIENLHLSIQSRQILNDINLSVLLGTCTVLIGPSGSGKSSLLKCINLLNEYDHGTIKLRGQDIKQMDRTSLRKQVGMVFQQYNLFDHLTVEENCTLALRHVLGLTIKTSKEIAYQYLTQVKMKPFINTYPQQLSGGQQQRVAIARAMCLQPQVLLLDEPTAALDPEMSYEVLETIEGLAEQGVTMVYVTHELNMAKQIANQVVFMEDGNVISQGSVESVLIKPKHKRIKTFINKLSYQL